MSDQNIFTGKITVPLLAILACILWGSAFPSLKISYAELKIAADDFFAKMLFASFRFMLAAVLLFIFTIKIKGKKSLKLTKSDFGYLLMLGFLQTTLQYFFFYNGLANTTGVKASILTTLSIFLTVGISHFLYLDDKLTSGKIMGLIFGFIGVIIVNLSRGEFSFSFNLLGEGFIIFSAVTSTIAFIFGKSITGRVEPLIITAYQMLFGSILLFLIAITNKSPLSLHFTNTSIILIIYLAFVSAAGFGIWYNLIKYNRLGYVSIYRFMIPVSGVLFSALFLVEEKITVNIFIALLLVSSGIVLINYRKTGTRRGDFR